MKKLVVLLVIVVALLCSVLPITAFLGQKAFQKPEKGWAEPTVYFAARVRMRLSRFVSAGAILREAVKTWPQSDRVDEAHYWIGFCYEQSQVHDQAIVWYKAFLQLYPAHQWAAQAKRRLDTLEAQNL
jgi:TolA-binding protein